MASYGVGTPYVPYDSASVTKAKGPRAPLYQKTDQQIKILNQWWKTKTRTGNIDKTLVDIGEKQRLASKTGLPLKVLENWLGNSRKKARKIAREGGALPTQPITKRGKAKKPKPKPKPKPKAKGKGKGKSKRKGQTQKSEQQLFILNSWWEQKISGGGIEATLVDAEEKRALAQATGLELKILDYWLSNTRKKARKQAAQGYM